MYKSTEHVPIEWFVTTLIDGTFVLITQTMYCLDSNTTAKTPPYKHHHTNTTTKTPPQNHHHKITNTTTPPQAPTQNHQHQNTPVPLHTTEYYFSTTPVLQSTTPYYKVLLHYYKVLFQYYKVYSSTTPYYKVLLQYANTTKYNTTTGFFLSNRRSMRPCSCQDAVRNDIRHGLRNYTRLCS